MRMVIVEMVNAAIHIAFMALQCKMHRKRKAIASLVMILAIYVLHVKIVEMGQGAE